MASKSCCMKFYLLLGVLLFSYCTTQAQGMAVNNDGSTADASALVDIKSTTKGMLIPRMTKTEKNGIASPAAGLMIFQTGPDSTGFHYYSGSQWIWMSSSANAWQLAGNSGTSPATNFIGTTDNNPLVFRTQNAEAMRITSSGAVGIGAATPSSTLQVGGTIAVGVTMGLTGGPSATPVSLANQKSYIGCSPADNTNNFYQLPDAASVPGRIYYIRNNSSSFFANIVSAGGIIFPGASDIGAGGNTYTLNPTTTVKTVICISDGTNWTVGKID
jgi:hypothetical protein